MLSFKAISRKLYWVLALITLLPTLSFAFQSEEQTLIDSLQLFDKYERSEKPIDTKMLGEFFDPFTGTMTFIQTDIDLPGNFDLPVKFSRIRRPMLSGFSEGKWGDPRMQQHLLGDWRLDIPMIPEAYDERFDEYCGDKQTHRTTATFSLGPSAYNIRIIIPPLTLQVNGKTLKLRFLHPDNEHLYPPGVDYVTEEHWFAYCDPYNNGKFEMLIQSPDGDTYLFDNDDRVSAYLPSAYQTIPAQGGLYATKVTDKHGNWVKYENVFGPAGRIHSSDGREILFYRDNGNENITRAVAGGRTWTYEYGDRIGIHSEGPNVLALRKFLSKVTRPDGKSYNFVYSGFDSLDMYDFWWDGWKQNPGSHFRTNSTHETIGKIIEFYMFHPDGPLVRYTFEIDTTCMGRHVKLHPIGGNNCWGDYENSIGYDDFGLGTAIFAMLDEKKVWYSPTGTADITSTTWEYNYYGQTYFDSEGLLNDPFFNGESPKGHNFRHRVTEIINLTEGIKEHYTYADGNDYYWMINGGPEPDTLPQAEFLYGDLVSYEIYGQYNNTPTKGEYYKYRHEPITNRWCDVGARGYGYYVERDSRLHCTSDEILNPSLSLNDPSHVRSIVTKVTTLMDGSEYYTENLEFNQYRKVTIQKESNNFSSDVKYTKNLYYTNKNDLFIDDFEVGIPRSTSYSDDGVNWTEVNRFNYNGRYNRVTEFLFGVANNHIYNRHSNGLPKKVSFEANDMWVEYASYKAGIPTEVRIADATSPLGYSSAYQTVDVFGNILSHTDFNGNKTDFSFDAVNRLISINPADSAWDDTNIQYIYATGRSDAFMKKVATKGALEETVYYDKFLRPILQVKKDLNLLTESYTSMRFNSENKPTFVSYVSDNEYESEGIKTYYDELHRLSLTQETTTNNTTTHRYLNGNRIAIKDYRGYETITSYEAYGKPETERATFIESPEGSSTEIKYNLFGNIEEVSQGGYVSTYIYDDQQRLCKLFRPESGWSYYDYNQINGVTWEAHGLASNNNNCDRSVVAADQKRTYEYDRQGRWIKTVYPDQSVLERSYDPEGNILRVKNSVSEWNYTYNSINKITSETLNMDGKLLQVSRGYNSLGYENYITYPSGKSVAINTDALGQPRSIGSYVSDISYHSNGAWANITYGNGVTYSSTQDVRKLPSNMYLALNGSYLYDVIYGYDENSNVSYITDNIDHYYSLDLDYDGLNRLITANGYWGNGSLVYDTTGNILEKQLGSQSLHYSYDTLNRLMSVSGAKSYQFGYDARGNVTSNGNNTFFYDAANTLTIAGNKQFKYDGNGNRVSKTSSGNTSYSLYDQSGRLIYRQKKNGDHVDYIYLGRELLTTVESR